MQQPWGIFVVITCFGGLAGIAQADHCQELRRHYDWQLEQLEDDYKARRERLQDAHERQQDQLRHERKRVLRHDGPYKHQHVKALDRERRYLTRQYHEAKRALHEGYKHRRELLRDEREQAVRDCREGSRWRSEPQPRRYRHYEYGYRPDRYYGYDHRPEFHPHDAHREELRGPRVDWVGLALELWLRRRGHP